MANPVEMFKQRQAALDEQLQIARAIEASLQAATVGLNAIVRDEALRTLLVEGQRLVQRTEAAVEKARVWRHEEAQRFYRPLAWRWAVATAFALLASAAAGTGYAWAGRPDADEIAYLRSRNSFADALESRMVRMTPAERRQLDALLQLRGSSK